MPSSSRVASLLAAARGKVSASDPDFTQGGKKDHSHDWTLGPAGARGWIFGANGHAADSRQILITEVAKGSPADGVLESGDVILGIGDQPFAEDARIQFEKAIGAAEVETGDGTLKLLRWRDYFSPADKNGSGYPDRYGVHAKEVMPQLQKMREELVETQRGGEKSKSVQELDQGIAKINSSTATPTVLDLKDFKKRP